MNKIEDVEVDFGSVRELVLTTLQKSEYPIELKRLLEIIGSKIIGTNRESVISSITSLESEGYDIKELIRGSERLFTLVRYPSYSEEDLFRIHGDIQTPVLLTGDWHIGSKGFYKIGYNKLKSDVKKFGINDVCIAGDIIQGRGVFNTELSELALPSITDQITLAEDLINDLDAKVHLIPGNHEEKVQGSVHIGLDPIKLIAKACPDATYYGHVCHLLLNKDYRYMMIHGSGAATQATSHMVEKIWRDLQYKPNVLHMGHNHQLDFVRKDTDKIALNSGTLQRTNAWLLQKGFNAKVGWFILKDIPDRETMILIDRHPILN